MTTPALDALLKEVEERQMVYHDEVDVRWKAAPRLAAMLRVAVDALERLNDPWGDAFPTNIAGNALIEVERIAKGEA